MNPIRLKMIAFVTAAAHKEIEALDPDSALAKELSKIDDVDRTISEEIEKICKVATWTEITKVLFMVKRLKKAPREEQETIKNALNSIAEDLSIRVERESGPLKLRETCLHLFSEL